jgi:hypothetical protein
LAVEPFLSRAGAIGTVKGDTAQRRGARMQTLHRVFKADANGVLHIDLPVGLAGGEYDVVLVWQMKPPAPEGSPESRGWPPGFLEQTYGSIQDEAFRRYPQGEAEDRMSQE